MKQRSTGLILGATVLIVLIGGLLVLKGNSNRSGSSTGSPPGSASSGAVAGGPGGAPGGFAEFQKSHRYAFQLMRLISNVGRIEEEGKAALTPAQAKSMLALLQPLRELESLDEPAAEDAIVALQDILTDQQRSAISALPPDPQFRRSGPPPGQASSGPPPGAAADRLGSFNPLKPHVGRQGNKQHPGHLAKLFDDLEKKSEGN